MLVKNLVKFMKGLAIFSFVLQKKSSAVIIRIPTFILTIKKRKIKIKSLPSLTNSFFVAEKWFGNWLTAHATKYVYNYVYCLYHLGSNFFIGGKNMFKSKQTGVLVVMSRLFFSFSSFILKNMFS